VPERRKEDRSRPLDTPTKWAKNTAERSQSALRTRLIKRKNGLKSSMARIRGGRGGKRERKPTRRQSFEYQGFGQKQLKKGTESQGGDGRKPVESGQLWKKSVAHGGRDCGSCHKKGRRGEEEGDMAWRFKNVGKKEGGAGPEIKFEVVAKCQGLREKERGLGCNGGVLGKKKR